MRNAERDVGIRRGNLSPEAGGGFLAGVGDVWRGGAFLLGHPRLWPWAAIPFVLNVLLFVGIAWLGWHFVSEWLQPFFTRDVAQSGAIVGWLMWLAGWLLRILYWLVLGMTALFTFVPLATVVAAPFNDVLSDKVERLYAGAGIDEGFSLRLLARSVWIGATSSLILAAKTMALLLAAMLLYLIPVAGAVLAPAAQAAITIRFLALEYTSYSMDRRYYNHRRRAQFLRAHRWRTIGMGAMAFGIMLVPVVNAMFIPVSAVAGTLLFCDAELGGKKR